MNREKFSLTDLDFMGKALLEAQKAFACGEVPVGAILVFEGQVIARSYNQMETLKDPSAHAELLCIRKGAQMLGDWRLLEATLYTTLEPCLMCAGAIVHSRIARLIFGARDPKAGAVESLYHVLNDPRLNHHVQVTEGIQAERCQEIVQSFFQRRRG